MIKSLSIDLPDGAFDIGHHSLGELIENMAVRHRLCPGIMFSDRARYRRLQLVAQLGLKLGKAGKANLLHQSGDRGRGYLRLFSKTGDRPQTRDWIISHHHRHQLPLGAGQAVEPILQTFRNECQHSSTFWIFVIIPSTAPVLKKILQMAIDSPNVSEENFTN